MKNTIVCLIILLTFSRCSDFAIKKKVIDNYYIIAGDDDEDAILSYHESKPDDAFGGALYGGIIEATVFGAGYDDKYIIVEQHPRTFPNPSNKNITNYFILPLKNGMDGGTKNGLIGPLTPEQFNKQRKKLGIGDNVRFTTVIHELE